MPSTLLKEKRWIYNNPGAQTHIDALIHELKIHPVLCRLLTIRGITTFDKAKAFFRPIQVPLHDPFLMRDMDKAVDAVNRHLSAGNKILVYGDYDVDGTTAVALMYTYLLKNKASVDFYIPDRYSEGYGISFQGIDFASEHGFQLIIALDCGIKSNDKVRYAKEKGIDMIICDHHLPGAVLPEAVAVLDPKVKECNYPFKELSGCGIGYKLIEALEIHAGSTEPGKLEEYLDLVAVSIASDLVPLTGENRLLASRGMAVLNEKRRPGLRAIMELAQMNRPLTISDVVFMIGPRINAAGRITSGRKAVELLISDHPETAELRSEEINRSNQERRLLDKQVTEMALSLIASDPDFGQRKSTVVFHESWHKGVVGIVASRLIEHYYRPTIVLTENNGKITGSARSVKDFDVHLAIERCSAHLEQFGGHKYAAGLTLSPSKLEAFTMAFEHSVASQITEEQLIPSIEIDAVIRLADLSGKFFGLLKQFEPFGPGNMAPVFCAKGLVSWGTPRIVGSNHLKVDLLEPDSGIWISGIGFGLADKLGLFENRNRVDAAFTLEENEFNGKISLQLNIKDLKESSKA